MNSNLNLRLNEIATERLKDRLKYRQGNGLPPQNARRPYLIFRLGTYLPLPLKRASPVEDLTYLWQIISSSGTLSGEIFFIIINFLFIFKGFNFKLPKNTVKFRK